MGSSSTTRMNEPRSLAFAAIGKIRRRVGIVANIVAGAMCEAPGPASFLNARRNRALAETKRSMANKGRDLLSMSLRTANA